MLLLLYWRPQSTSNESQEILEIMVGVFANFLETESEGFPIVKIFSEVVSPVLSNGMIRSPNG
jgi:hypothetical protein